MKEYIQVSNRTESSSNPKTQALDQYLIRSRVSGQQMDLKEKEPFRKFLIHIFSEVHMLYILLKRMTLDQRTLL